MGPGDRDDGEGPGEKRLAHRQDVRSGSRDQRLLSRFAATLYSGLSTALLPRVFNTLERSLWWQTYGRIRATRFSMAFLWGTLGTSLAIWAATATGMAISLPMCGVLLFTGSYLVASLYTSYVELNGKDSTPELEEGRTAQDKSEDKYKALEDHADQMRRNGATPEEIGAELDSKRQDVIITYLRQITRVSGDTSEVINRLGAARDRRDEGYTALAQHAAQMRSSGATAAQIEAEIANRREAVLIKFEGEIEAAGLPALYQPLQAAKMRRDESLKAMDVHAAHMRKHGVSREEVEATIRPMRLAATRKYLREIEAKVDSGSPSLGEEDRSRRPPGPDKDLDS